MEPILSNLTAKETRNEPRDLLSRLYREIGISAVSAALQMSNDARRQPTPREKREALAKSAA